MSYYDVIMGEPGLQSYWPLNEQADSAIDRKGSITGTVGTSVTRAGKNIAPGLNSSMYSNAWDTTSNGLITFGDVYEFGGTASFSLEFWVIIESYGPNGNSNNNAPICNWGGSGAGQGGYYLSTYEPVGDHLSGLVGWILTRGDGVTNTQAFSSGPYPPIQYQQHVVVTYDGSNIIIYVNGNAGSPYNTTTPLNTGRANGLTLAGYDGGGTYGDGFYSDFAIYDIALSASRIQAHYNAGITPSFGAPVLTHLGRVGR